MLLISSQPQRRTSALLALLSALVLLVAGPVNAGSPATLVITSVDTSQYPTVRIRLASPSADPRLLAEDTRVVVSEAIGGTTRPVAVSARAPQHVGVSVVVLVDLHRRMSGIGMPAAPDGALANQPLTRLETARAAILELARGLAADGPDNRIGIIGYHRDLITVLPLKKLDVAEVERVVSGSPPDGRLFDIARRIQSLPPNDVSDPHARSALSLAVTAAVDELEAGAPSAHQQAIVIIGNTCDDLRNELSKRVDLPCLLHRTTRDRLTGYQHHELLTLTSVGVGDTDTQQTLVEQRRREQGFEYAPNFSQLSETVGVLPHGRFFQLHPAPGESAAQRWERYRQAVIAPLQARSTQLALTYTAPHPIFGTPASQVTHTVKVELDQLQAQSAYQAPQLSVRLDGQSVSQPTIRLEPGPHRLSIEIMQGQESRGVATIDVAAAAGARSVETLVLNQPPPDLTPLIVFAALTLFALLLLGVLIWATERDLRRYRQLQGLSNDAAPAAPRRDEDGLKAPDGKSAPLLLMHLCGELAGKAYPIAEPKQIGTTPDCHIALDARRGAPHTVLIVPELVQDVLLPDQSRARTEEQFLKVTIAVITADRDSREAQPPGEIWLDTRKLAIGEAEQIDLGKRNAPNHEPILKIGEYELLLRHNTLYDAPRSQGQQIPTQRGLTGALTPVALPSQQTPAQPQP